MNKYQSLFDICGTVIHGRGIGKLMGMPTANIKCYNVALPKYGIYLNIIKYQFISIKDLFFYVKKNFL